MSFNPIPQPPAPPPSGANYSAEHGCFEGPEKLLEIWFSSNNNKYHGNKSHSLNSSDSEMSDISSPSTPNESQIDLSLDYPNDLRSIERSYWDSMLATVKCTVLSVVKNTFVDAYLLSESSMFVFPNRIVLKTCGTTALLKAIPYILKIAKIHCGYESIYRLFYSRKSFMFPEKQPGPHRSWEEEVNYLDSHFDNGASYVIGNTNSDEWYLYLTSPEISQFDTESLIEIQQTIQETGNSPWIDGENSKYTTWKKTRIQKSLGFNSNNFYGSTIQHSNTNNYHACDETIEILMTNLDPEAMRAFYHRDNEPAGLIGGKRVDNETGLDQLYPKASVDSYLFEPCGYSCNGILDDGYYTIHVTPEPQCSYASFETTIMSKPVAVPSKNGHGREEATRKLIRQVIDIFQPGSLTITYFSSYLDAEQQVDNFGKLLRTVDQFGGYKRKDKILHEFDGYDFIFAHYKKL